MSAATDFIEEQENARIVEAAISRWVSGSDKAFLEEAKFGTPAAAKAWLEEHQVIVTWLEENLEDILEVTVRLHRSLAELKRRS